MRSRPALVLPLAALALAFHPALRAAEAPRLVEKDGRHALLVDGQPYLVLGAQINNSSSWPETLSKVWPALEALHANTAEAPVYWEQMEARPGVFDFSTVDALLQGAREHHLHLILLWFGTWKNGNMHYAPEWVKTDPARYPRMINASGQPIDVLSANSTVNRDADQHAFAALMRHLKEADSTEHTVVMIQVENESGGIGAARDFSPASEKEFQGQAPADLLKALHKPKGSWREVFRGEADEVFQAYFQSRYVNAVAAAGKAEFAIPMYCNVWLSYPPAELPERQAPNPGIGYPSGGPTQNRLDLWKAMAPAIDLIGPDIYSDDPAFYNSILHIYARPDNALWIPETGSGDSFAKFFFSALGDGAIGFSPFGVDHTSWTYATGEGPKSHAENYALIAPMDREIARLNFDGKLKTAVEEAGSLQQEVDFGDWKATVSFGFPQPDGRRPPGTSDHHGRALIAQLGPGEFLVTGVDASVAFHQPGMLPGIRAQILRAEEGFYEGHNWHFVRLWNGDQTDRGLNFKQGNYVVRIRMGRF